MPFNRKIIYRILLCQFLVFFCTKSIAQSTGTEDALWKTYYASKGDTNSILTLIKISTECYTRDRILAEKIANKAVYESKKLNNKRIQAQAISRLTNVYFDNGKYEESYYLADELLKLSSEIKDDLIYADACKLIGRRYHFRGEYPKAQEYYLKSLAYFEKTNSIIPMGEVFNSMGGVYLNQQDFKNAYLYYHKSQLINFKRKFDKGIAGGYLNIANVFIGESKFDAAKLFLDSAIYFYDRAKSEEGKAYVFATFSEIYIAQNKTDSALKNLLYSYAILKTLNKLYTLTQVNASISDQYFKQNDLKNALWYVNEGIDIAQNTKQSHNIAPLFLLKSRILEKMGKVNEAFENYKKFKAFTDTVLNASAIRKQAEAALNYDYNKKEYQREIEKQVMLVEQKERETKQRFFFNSMLIGIVLLSAILFLVIRSYRSNQRNSKIIASQKAEVEKQHHLLQEKNKEVLDSINYAKRLQSAILPSPESIRKHLPTSFVLYKPKDIVAGDFYWMEIIHASNGRNEQQELILFAAADCTGHGVPGSLVSVVCSNALNRAVFEFELADPGEILNKTRELVIATFEKSDNEVKDGMDISLCCYQPETQKLNWAGANNPLWIIHSNGTLTEIKANKQPIGKYTAPTPFTTHSISLTKGDRMYFFTDGFADQFGGEKGKKFKYKQLQSVLLSSYQSSMSEQKIVLETTFNNWKGDLEQVDDVCVIGIEV